MIYEGSWWSKNKYDMCRGTDKEHSLESPREAKDREAQSLVQQLCRSKRDSSKRRIAYPESRDPRRP